MAGKRDEADFQARRTMLLDAAAELFAAEGLHNVSLRQIGWALGRTPGVFTMFDGKQDVVRAVIERQLDDLLAFVGAGLGVLSSIRGEQFQTWEPPASTRSAPTILDMAR